MEFIFFGEFTNKLISLIKDNIKCFKVKWLLGKNYFYIKNISFLLKVLNYTKHFFFTLT